METKRKAVKLVTILGIILLLSISLGFCAIVLTVVVPCDKGAVICSKILGVYKKAFWSIINWDRGIYL